MRVTAPVKHRVVAGDTLLYLSWMYYGSASGIPWIWLENLNAIGCDPDNLCVGQVLIIPVVELRRRKVEVNPNVVKKDSLRVGDRRITASFDLYGESWRWQVFKVIAQNARPWARTTLNLPGRGEGFPVDAASALRREVGGV